MSYDFFKKPNHEMEVEYCKTSPHKQKHASLDFLFSVSDVIPHDRNWIPILAQRVVSTAAQAFQLQPRHFQCSPGAFPPQPRSISTAAQGIGI